MTLNHSKTWPISTMAVVQLRVDPQGRTYKTHDDEEPECEQRIIHQELPSYTCQKRSASCDNNKFSSIKKQQLHNGFTSEILNKNVKKNCLNQPQIEEDFINNFSLKSSKQKSNFLKNSVSYTNKTINNIDSTEYTLLKNDTCKQVNNKIEGKESLNCHNGINNISKIKIQDTHCYTNPQYNTYPQIKPRTFLYSKRVLKNNPCFLNRKQEQFHIDANKLKLKKEKNKKASMYNFPFTKNSPEYFANMPHPHLKHTVRTDTVSTILEQELDSENNEIVQPEPKKYEKFHVLALARIDENEQPADKINALGRRQSVKVDNWDLIYTEANRVCPKHCADNGCKVKSLPPCQEHKNCRLPDVPLDARKAYTLRRHYYPEGGWGWIVIVCTVLVQILNHGLPLSSSQLVIPGAQKFKTESVHVAGWLGAMSTGVALFISPVTIAFCRRKSTRVTAVMGGLITALGCLFTSFATQFHQLFFSYGTVVGIGVGITRDCSTLMVAQYFKRRREFVEIFIVSGSGLGIAVMSVIIKTTIGALGWRLGLQVVTGAVSVTFILGTFYRSASLYHPQRRAILHIKNQKRKIKDKNKIEDKVPFFDFSTLKSKTVRILLVSTGISAFGINTPLFYLAYQAEVEGLGDSTVFLQMYLGLAWTVGCVVFSTLVLHNSTECRIARQYLCQTAVFMCGLSILAFTVVSGNYHAYVMFAWIYGIFCGGYHYSLKMYTYERVRARNFARTWGFVQCSQAIPIVIGVPFSGYMNERCGDRAGYYFSSTCVLVGSLTLFLIDLHRRNISRHKHTRENGTRHLCVSETCPQRRKLSFSQDNDNEPGVTAGAAAAALVLGADLAPNQPGLIDNIVGSNDKPELTCISEEGIADMDLPDNLLDDLDYIGDCITSCNKVENYLMLSEFENNLIAEMPVILDRRGRRWSLARPKLQGNGNNEEPPPEEGENGSLNKNNSKWKVFPNRVITVIDESSV